MGRAPCCDQNGLKKGPWTPEEDQKLIDYIQKHGHGSWRTLPKNAGLARCGKSCRLRWTNYLRPDIKRGRFSFEEEETIIQLHSVFGNKWSAIAARLPGRTDNEIKNYWNTHIRKRLVRMGIDPVTHSPRLERFDLSSIMGSPLCNPNQLNLSRLFGIEPLLNSEILRLATKILSSTSTQSQTDQNSNLLAQFLQQNQLHSSIQLQNAFSSLQNSTHIPEQMIPTSPSSNVFGQNQPLDIQSQVMQMPNNANQFASQAAHTGGGHIAQTSQWQTSNDGVPSNFDQIITSSTITSDCFSLMSTAPEQLENILNAISGTPNFQLSSSHNDLSLLNSAVSTTSLSQLNSPPNYINGSGSTTPSSTCINGSTEDDRDSYCSTDLLKFQIPDLLDLDDFLC